MKKIFNTYLFADWSASSRPTRVEPKKDAIWIGELEGHDAEPKTYYCRTRRQAASLIQERLGSHLAAGRRTLVGFDFPYGYPSGTGQALGIKGTETWMGLWETLSKAIEDTERNANNRWDVAASLNQHISPSSAGPFWGCPNARQAKTLTSRKIGYLSFPYALPGGGELRRRRHPERRLPGTQEVWKLLGAGSVGSQTLVGIPYVRRLRYAKNLENRSCVWPFETGFSVEKLNAQQPSIVHAEIWPGVVEPAVRANAAGRIRDRVQVEQLCLWASREDQNGMLQRLLERPTGLSDDEVKDCVQEEGWILGAE